MKSRTRQNIRRINRAKSRRHIIIAVFACIALLVAAGVALALRQNGRAATRQERVLDCPVSGTVAHTHDGSCYDDNGNLVCALPEVERHVHDDSCYSEERVLVCGMSEGEGAHWHDDSCYDEEGNLVCGLEETAGHVHDDSCYKVERTLVCGKDEVAEEHQHGPGCFQTGEVADSMPEQAFEHRFTDKDDRLVLDVRVDAPEGALPEGSTMEAEWVDTEAKKNAEVKTVVEEAVAKKTDAEIAEVHAVDITFRDAEGNEVEPAKKVTVTMASPQIADKDTSQLLVHVESDREAQERAERQGKDTYQVEGSVIKPLTAKQLKKRDLPDEADELVFDADQFSVYAVVYTVDFHWEVDGKKFDFSIPGGGSISLAELVETLGIAGKEASAGKSAKEFVGEVEKVDFSDPELVWVGKVDSKSTVGELKEANGLDVEYSAEMTEEQIAEINAQTVGAGDWALISMQPFTTEETLTVTMNDGEVFSIHVTDAQIKKTVIDAKGDTWEITVTYGEDARIPDGAELKVREILPEDEKYEQYFQQSLEKVGVTASKTDKADDPAQKAVSDYARIFDIEIWADDHKVEPAANVTVNVRLLDAPEDTQAAPQVVHFAEDGAELMALKDKEENIEDEGIQFVTDEFSIYSVVFTVDFSYEINGKVYRFTMQGADSVSLRALIDALHVYELVEKDKSDTSDSDSQFEAEVANADLAEQDDTQNAVLDSFMNDIKTVTFSNEQLLVPAKVEEDTTVGKIKTDLNLFPTYPLGLKQSEVLELNAKEYTAGDWALISMKAFDTEEKLTITMNTGESFDIIVTDAQDAVMIGDQVQTISNPAGTTIDLFDYWIVSQDLVGRDGWGDLNQDWGGHPDTEGDNGYNLNGSGNNKGINSSDVDSVHGHALKFSPAWDGTVYNGTKEGTHRYYPNWDSGDHNTYYDVQESWRSLNQQGKDGLNSYTGDADPFQGIVGGTLVNGYPVLTSNDTKGSNGESLAYLFDTGFPHAGKASYPGVNQLLYVDKEGYYTYDSRDYRADYNNGTFVLTEQTSDNTEIRGFWPFGTQNFWAGLHINTQFSMPVNGQVLNPSGEYKDMQFEFSGDDDTWLYVDGVLVGDGGGIHNRTEIDVNFSKGTVTVTGKKGGGHSGDFEETNYLDDIFTAAGKYNEDQWEESGDGSGHKRFKPGTYHTFDMFYLERGGGESNLYIHFNLVSTADFTAHKSYYGEDETDLLRRDQFQFELIGLDGKYRSVKNDETGNYELVQADPTADAIMPHASGSGAGTVASPHYEDNVSTTLSNGDTVNSQVYITAVTEDGNVNFGSASISEMDMNEADHGNPPVYKYIIREIVPDDAVNQDGTTWASATDAQKAAGGFVKDQVTYDGTVYYMTGTVTSWTETNASGQEVVRHGISKTYYTDDTYTTVRDDVDFANFENRFTPDYGSVDFTKVDGAGEPLEGAEFTLYKDEACTIPATDLDTEGHPVWMASSDSNGKVSFENVRVGTYFMKETTAPQGYKLSDTVYKVTIVGFKDKSSASTIIRNDDETETEIKKVFNTRISTEGLEVDKIWKGGEPSSDTTIIYKLYQTSARTRAGNYTVDVSGLGYGKPDWSNGRSFTNDELTGDKAAIKKGSIIEIVITTTSDNWSFDTLNETTAITSNQTILSDVLANISDGSIRQRTIRIQVTDESTNTISLYGQLESCYDGNGGKPTISSRIISEPSSSEEGETKLVCTVTLGKNTVSSNLESVFQNLDPAIVITTGTNDWTSVIKNLPENASEGDWKITYAYYVEEVETSIPSGYELDFISPASAVPGETITIVNTTETPESISVVIKKTDNAENSTNYLDGAVFKLMYRSDSSGTYTNVSSESVPQLNSESKFTVPIAGITLTGLVDGQYQLQEISPPSGYVITNSTPVTFTVSGGAINSTEGTITGVRYTAASETSDAEFIIPNEPGAALPSAGGPGARLFTILGSILILGAGVLLWRRRRTL